VWKGGIRDPCAEAVKRVEQTKRSNERSVRGEIATRNVWTQTYVSESTWLSLLRINSRNR